MKTIIQLIIITIVIVILLHIQRNIINGDYKVLIDSQNQFLQDKQKQIDDLKVSSQKQINDKQKQINDKQKQLNDKQKEIDDQRASLLASLDTKQELIDILKQRLKDAEAASQKNNYGTHGISSRRSEQNR